MTLQMVVVLILITIMLVLLIFEVARPGLILFGVLVTLMLLRIITPKEALNGFSNEGMITIALLFIVAASIQKSGFVDDLMKKWIEKSKTTIGTKIRFFVPLAILSAFLNNTPIVMTFMPVIKNWCEQKGISPSKYLIPLSYVTILGGTITLIGTSTNMVVHGMLLDYGYDGFSIFSFTAIGIPITIVGMIYVFTIGERLLPSHQGIKQQVSEHIKEYIAEIHVEAEFPYIHKTVVEAGFFKLDGLYLIAIIRDDGRISSVTPSTKIELYDRLMFTGKIGDLANLQKQEGLRLKTGADFDLDDLKNNRTHLVEAVISHQSSLSFKTIKQLKFRSKYDAGVIAVHRNNEHIRNKIGDIILKPGDSLLLLTSSNFIEKYRQSNDFYIISKVDTPNTIKNSTLKGIASLGLLLTMIVLVTFNVFSMLEAMALATLLLFITKLVNISDVKKNMDFQVLFVIACSLGIGSAMTKTGLAEWIATNIIHITKGEGILLVLVLIYVLTNIFTEVITNSAAAALMLPIALEISQVLDVDPIGLALLVAIAASASFMTPIGYQTNLIVYGPGGYKFFDYVKIGAPLSILVMITSITVIYSFWF